MALERAVFASNPAQSRGRLVAVEEVAPDWLHNSDREAEYLGL